MPCVKDGESQEFQRRFSRDSVGSAVRAIGCHVGLAGNARMNVVRYFF